MSLFLLLLWLGEEILEEIVLQGLVCYSSCVAWLER